MAKRLNLHIDESGNQDLSEGRYLLTVVLHDALDFVLAKNVADYGARRLLQVADYVCTVERIAEDYDAGRQSKTHERFFGNRRDFMQSFKKQLGRKALA